MTDTIRRRSRAVDAVLAAVGGAAAGRFRDVRSPADRWSDLVVGEVGVRRLRWSDGPAWVESMRQVEAHMRPWLHDVADWEDVAGPGAFRAHLLDAERRWMRGSGLSLALTARDTLVGEVGFWQTSSTHQIVEVGLWSRPTTLSRHDRTQALAATLDQIFTGPVERVHGPVSTGNHGPLGVLRSLGFEVVAHLPQWRPVGDGLGDVDLYALSKTRWQEVRPRVVG